MIVQVVSVVRSDVSTDSFCMKRCYRTRYPDCTRRVLRREELLHPAFTKCWLGVQAERTQKPGSASGTYSETRKCERKALRNPEVKAEYNNII
jgi:hypothetical protein